MSSCLLWNGVDADLWCTFVSTLNSHVSEVVLIVHQELIIRVVVWSLRVSSQVWGVIFAIHGMMSLVAFVSAHIVAKRYLRLFI